MGQAKRNRERLGKWYGHPIVPGHPDFVPPKKPEPVPLSVRFSANDSDEPPIDIGAETVSLFREDGRIVVDRLFSLYTKEPLGMWFSGNEGKGILFTGSIARRVELKEVDDRKAVFAWLGMPQEEPMHPEAARTLSGIDEARGDGLHAPQTAARRLPGMRPKERWLHGMAMLAILGLALASGIDLGSVPKYRPKKR